METKRRLSRDRFARKSRRTRIRREPKVKTPAFYSVSCAFVPPCQFWLSSSGEWHDIFCKFEPLVGASWANFGSREFFSFRAFCCHKCPLQVQAPTFSFVSLSILVECPESWWGCHVESFKYRNIARLFGDEVLINLPSHSKISFNQKLIMTSTENCLRRLRK